MIQVQIPKGIIKIQKQIIALESVLKVEQSKKDRGIHLEALGRLKSSLRKNKSTL